MTTDVPTTAEATWRLLARPLDAIFEHGPGVTMRQYGTLRRWFAGPDGLDEATMADLLAMDVLAQCALGPCPFDTDDYESIDRAVIAGWRDYWLRDGLDDVCGLSWKSAQEVRAATLAWWDEARAALSGR